MAQRKGVTYRQYGITEVLDTLERFGAVDEDTAVTARGVCRRMNIAESRERELRLLIKQYQRDNGDPAAIRGRCICPCDRGYFITSDQRHMRRAMLRVAAHAFSELELVRRVYPRIIEELTGQQQLGYISVAVERAPLLAEQEAVA